MVSSVSSSSLASAWANQIFSKLDTSNQGYIDKSALQKAFDNMSAANSSTASGTSNSSTSANTSNSNSNVDQLFSSLDSNNDGKVTKDELTSALQNLANQLIGAFDQMRMGRGHHHHGSGGSANATTATADASGTNTANAPGGMPPGPPPGPPPGGSGDGDGDSDDSGFTKNQLTQKLSTLSDADSQRTSFLSNIVSNFDKADSNGDGKVSRQEAMAFAQTQQTSSVGGTSTGNSSTSGNGTSNGNSEANVIQQLIKLMQSYGAIAQDGSGTSASNGFSVSA